MSEQAQAILASVGPLSAGMASHILLMNLVAPAVAVGSVRHVRAKTPRPAGLVAATLAQLALLYGWHAPSALSAAMHHPALHVAMQASLFVAALWFWRAVASAAEAGQWRAIAALLSTSKLFCLLGVLLTFAARPLYPTMAHDGVQALDPLADQQLAGLMMLVACPLSYLAAAVVVASRWLASLDPAGFHPEGAKVA